MQQEDIGVWTCAALVDQDIAEARDTITVSIGGNYSYIYNNNEILSIDVLKNNTNFNPVREYLVKPPTILSVYFQSLI